MERIELNDGEVILEEGAPSDYVYQILAGEVEIYSEQRGETIVLGILGGGDFLGEMGIIERRPRSASARARGSVVIEKLERWEFIQLISDSPVSVHRLIERLSERLRHVSQRLARISAERGTSDGSEAVDDDAANMHGPEVRLHAATETLASEIPAGGIDVASFPFTVGRKPQGDEPLSEIPVQLQIPDTSPYRLSPAHFSIIRADDGFAIHDLGSARGTSVNGVFIGELFERDICNLDGGENTVIAGGMYSLYGFKILVGDD